MKFRIFTAFNTNLITISVSKEGNQLYNTLLAKNKIYTPIISFNVTAVQVVNKTGALRD